MVNIYAGIARMKNTRKENEMIKEMTKEELVKKIKAILRWYFIYDDNGDPNPTFNEYYTAEEAIDDIKDLVGEI
jgi:hypothetical protein